MNRLELATAEPGFYVVRSESLSVYVLDLRDPARRRVARIRGGGGETGWFAGDDRWWPLVRVESGPAPSDDADADPGGVLEGVVRVGRRHRYTWVPRPRGMEPYQWRLQRTATAIVGPLTAEELVRALPAGRDRRVLLVPFVGPEDGDPVEMPIEDLAEHMGALLVDDGWPGVDVLDGLLVDDCGAVVEQTGDTFTVTLGRWSRLVGGPQAGTVARELADGRRGVPGVGLEGAARVITGWMAGGTR